MSERYSAGIQGGTNIGVTPTAFGKVMRGVYMAAAGDITFVMEDGTSLALVNMAAGVWHPMRFTEITAITTATGVVAGF
jgi:hypothetical protein